MTSEPRNLPLSMALPYVHSHASETAEKTETEGLDAQTAFMLGLQTAVWQIREVMSSGMEIGWTSVTPEGVVVDQPIVSQEQLVEHVTSGVILPPTPPEEESK